MIKTPLDPTQTLYRRYSSLSVSGRPTVEPLRFHQEVVSTTDQDGTRMKKDGETERKKIFIVDDHPLVRKWLATLINQQSDLRVCGEAGTASEAIKMIASAKPHVAIVDISMEGASRMELIRVIKATCPEVLVIVLSMHDELIYGERALRAGARGYVMKQEATRHVLQAVRCVLDGKLYLINEMAKMVAEKFGEAESPAPGFPLDLISDREFEVFKLLGRGRSNAEIAVELNVSVNTVRSFCARIKEKLKLSSATELRREAVLWDSKRNSK
jgi:DNA-binding NarL/FixJ family response regulator